MISCESRQALSVEFGIKDSCQALAEPSKARDVVPHHAARDPFLLSSSAKKRLSIAFPTQIALAMHDIEHRNHGAMRAPTGLLFKPPAYFPTGRGFIPQYLEDIEFEFGGMFRFRAMDDPNAQSSQMTLLDATSNHLMI